MHPVKEAETWMQVTMRGDYIDYHKRRSDLGQAEIKHLKTQNKTQSGENRLSKDKGNIQEPRILRTEGKESRC